MCTVGFPIWKIVGPEPTNSSKIEDKLTVNLNMHTFL